MRILVRFVLLAAFAPAAHAQVLPGDLLVNSFDVPDVLAHFRPDGTVVQTAAAGTGTSWLGAAILPNGNWVATRRVPYGVNIFDGVTGAELATWDMPPGYGGSTGDVGVFSDGTLAVTDQNGAVWRLDTAGNLIVSWSVPGSPFGILVDDNDEVWACDTGGVLWHTDDMGNSINNFSTGSGAGDVVMAQDGTLFVTRFTAGEVAHYAQDGTFLGSFVAGGNSTTWGLAMGPDQTLWVAGMFDPLLLNFDQAGTLLGSFSVGPAARPIFLTIPTIGSEDIGTNYCGPANLNSTGLSALISAFGSTTVSQNSVALTASQLPQNVFGYFLNSDTQGFKPFPPGSNGNLCLGGGIGRHAKQIANSGSAGELVIDVDLAALPRPGGTHSVVAGETWNFQCWFRDNQGGPTSNFTDGIEIVFQ
jgi:hypothetical protein